MKKLLLTVIAIMAITFAHGQSYVPAKKITKHFAKTALTSKLNLDCNIKIIQGQEYTGIIGSPCVAFGFASVYTKTGVIIPPNMGVGYLFSYGEGIGLSNGNLFWNNKIALGVCVTTGFKPINYSLPANIGVYAIWHSVAGGIYRDVANNIWGVSFGTSISLMQIQSTILSLNCLK